MLAQIKPKLPEVDFFFIQGGCTWCLHWCLHWCFNTILLLSAQTLSRFSRGCWHYETYSDDFSGQMRWDEVCPYTGVKEYSRVRRKGAKKRGMERGFDTDQIHTKMMILHVFVTWLVRQPNTDGYIDPHISHVCARPHVAICLAFMQVKKAGIKKAVKQCVHHNNADDSNITHQFHKQTKPRPSNFFKLKLWTSKLVD